MLTTDCPIDRDLAALLECGAKCVPVARKDKRPIGTDWPTLATDDHATIARWIGQHNVGICLGHGNLIDIEYDDADGRELWSQLQTADGVQLRDIETPSWQSSRGVHHLFRLSGQLPAKGWIKVGGLEIRLGGKPAQSVLPPSVHPTGARYAWLVSPQQCNPAVLTLSDLGLD